MAHYLVTGGCGFIGSHLVEALVKKSERVRVFDDCSTGKAENIAQVKDQVELIEGDLQDLEAVRKAVAEVDYVLHQGARPSVARSVADPVLSNDININGTLNVLVAARDEGVERVVFASSSSVYGNIPTLPKSEDLSPQPASPYAITKYAGERYCQVFSQIYGLETVALRYFNIFGPRQDPTSQYSAVIPKFIYAYLHGDSPSIDGDGEQSRDFTAVENAVDANILACHAKDVAGEVFNVGCGGQTSINQLASLVGKLTEVDAKPTRNPSRSGDVRHSCADIRKAQRLIGYHPQVDLKTGLRQLIDWSLQ